MASTSPLITIAIPTYNRSRYLRCLLDSLAPQLRPGSQHNGLVELLVSDNASSDDTQATLDEHRHQGLVFRNIRNHTNLGADGNIAQCFTEASGQYVWIIGDDDVVLPGGIRILIDLLLREDLDLVHLRSRTLTGDPVLDQACVPSPRIELIDDARTFALRTHVFLTFITGNVINKKRVMARLHQPFSDLIGTSLVQLGWTYPALREFRKGACILDPIIAASAEARGGYPLITVFGCNLKRITETWLVEPALTRIVLNGTLQVFFPPFVLAMRLGEGAFAQAEYADLLHALYSNKRRYYIFIYPLVRLPAPAARAWFFLCRVINKIDKAIGNPMLK
ncbi:MAG: glycosyltransferase [Acidobacteriota bacterium]|nr:glycosyltransferase [Acidobacteriota bacterium]